MISRPRHEPLPDATEEVISSIIDAGVAVHRELGPGFTEAVYRNAMCLEMADRCLSFEAEKSFVLKYRGRPVATQRVDLVVAGQVIVELKAVRCLEEIHCAQLLSYLKGTGIRAGLLMNFGGVTLRAGLRRMVV
jgi:GxxExxY protein